MAGPSISDFVTFWELVERRAAATPDLVVAVDERGCSLTGAGYRDAAERVAAALHARGVGVGTNVSWLMPTWLEASVLAAALARLGAVQNPMLPIYREREVRFITRQTGARLILTPSEWRGFDYASLCRDAARELPGAEVLVCDRRLPEGDVATLPPDESVVRAVDAPVRWIYYTSGTTAEPKGVMHTDATVRASADGLVASQRVTPDDVAPLVFPYAHIGGLFLTFAGLMSGMKLVFVESFVPANSIPVLAREGVTLPGSGTVFHMAYLDAQRRLPKGQRLFSRARAFPGGGAPKPPQLHYDVKAECGGIGIMSAYGSTECPNATSARLDDDDEQLAHTEGRPNPGVRLRIVGPDGREVRVGAAGEVRMKAPQMFRGYVDADLDAEAFDDDGWFRTGDLGRLTATGHLVITGRLKDVIIRKGENISAKEVEDLLFTHPDVADVAVIGLPDPVLGERCCAVVVPADPGDPPALSELLSFLVDAGMTRQKCPEQLEIRDELPRNPSGKVLKRDLRGVYGGESSPRVSSSAPHP